MMRLNKSTRYALYAAMELAASGPSSPVTASCVAERYAIPPTVMAKVFQQLVREGIAMGVRGAGGGYRLERSPAQTTVLDVIDAFEPSRASSGCLLDDRDGEPCERPDDCRLKRLFDEVDELARSTFASVTLETLIGRGLVPPGDDVARR